jgi:hypothetical protein
LIDWLIISFLKHKKTPYTRCLIPDWNCNTWGQKRFTLIVNCSHKKWKCAQREKLDSLTTCSTYKSILIQSMSMSRRNIYQSENVNPFNKTVGKWTDSQIKSN